MDARASPRRWASRSSQVDAFTDRPFAGNPAAICLLDGPADEQWMQAVAAEMQPVGDRVPRGGARPTARPTWRLRWFTPVSRSICAATPRSPRPTTCSPTSASPPTMLRFVTLSGTLTARALGDGWIQLDFPADPPVEAEAPAGLLEALGVTDRSRCAGVAPTCWSRWSTPTRCGL